MYAGLVQQEETIYGAILVKNSSDVPLEADALPTYRVYGPDGFLVDGTCSFLDSGTVTGASDTSPVVINSVGHGLTAGARVTVSGVLGNLGANGTYIISAVTADTFTLANSTGSSTYTSGGTWRATGAYRYSIPCLGASGFDAGVNYDVVFNYLISTIAYGQLDSFTVV